MFSSSCSPAVAGWLRGHVATCGSCSQDLGLEGSFHAMKEVLDFLQGRSKQLKHVFSLHFFEGLFVMFCPIAVNPILIHGSDVSRISCLDGTSSFVLREKLSPLQLTSRLSDHLAQICPAKRSKDMRKVRKFIGKVHTNPKNKGCFGRKKVYNIRIYIKIYKAI